MVDAVCGVQTDHPARADDIVVVGAVATEGTHWDRPNRPEGCPTVTPPLGAEKLFRYYDDVRDDWLLLLESEQPPPGYDDSIFSSGGAPNGEWLGWVLPNVDSDGDWVIDAWELLLGTDPQDADSDDDGCSDGDEILGYGHPYLSELSDPLAGVCHLELRIFANGFESGDLSAWDGSVP